jgi:hypothetical protein
VSAAHEKAVGVLDTPPTADTSKRQVILSACSPAHKDFHLTAARFAIKGHALQRSIRADDGRVTYTVSRWDQSRSFTHWNDVLAFLAQIGGVA